MYFGLWIDIPLNFQPLCAAVLGERCHMAKSIVPYCLATLKWHLFLFNLLQFKESVCFGLHDQITCLFVKSLICASLMYSRASVTVEMPPMAGPFIRCEC